MGFLEWHDRRPVDVTAGSGDEPGPVLVAAFEGWNDAGDAATGAIEHLWQQWGATTIASIPSEEFFDFTATRPLVRVGDDGRRTIDWPANELGRAVPDGTRGVVLLRGVEPQLRWRTFCDQVLTAATELRCSSVITVGALLADVAHSRPTPVFASSEDDVLRNRFALESSDYEGPTGIVGVLGAEATHRRLPAVAVWAAVPSYAPSTPSPKAAVALVGRIVDLLGATVDTSVLDLATVSYEHQLDGLIAEDDDTVAYVRFLEHQHDTGHLPDDPGTTDGLLDEVERFLRDQ